KEMNQFDVNKGWEKLHNRIITSSEGSAVLKKERKTGLDIGFGMPLLKVAAAIALVVALGVASYFLISGLNNDSVLTVVSSVTDDQTRVILPDGSLVFLNADTKISYSKNFNTDGRVVRLTGEAYFDVSPDPERPFTIYSGKAGIKVLGTSFNVQALKSSGKVEVFVESGKVQLFEAENVSNTITIEPGFIGSIEDASVEKQMNTDENYLAWKTRKLFFNNTDLARVAEGIKDVFKVNLVFKDPDMTNCKIRSNFENETLENVIETICTIHNWEWEKRGNKIILSGQGC
ncbi:MAG: FecR domain-containing protein, partial [Bacteroidales bacterium]|nr:FecR domain-containing protein [Bacteroidales bacterium]